MAINRSVSVTPSEIRQARAFLFNRNIPITQVKPIDLARLSKKMGSSFLETMKVIAVLKLGGQGLGPAPIGAAAAGVKDTRGGAGLTSNKDSK